MTGLASRQRFVVLGDAMADYTVRVSDAACRDEKCAVDASCRSLGGTGANAAVTIRLLGGHVELVATLSQDAFGAWVRDRLAQAGVDASRLRFVQGGAPQATIVLLGKERRVLVDRGVADDVLVPTSDELAGAALIYVSNPVVVLPRLRAPAGVPLIVGVEHQMVKALPPADLTNADVVVTNATGWSALSRLKLDVPVLETRGAAGVRIHAGASEVVEIPTEPVPARNATGAGDAFAGAFCWYYARSLPLVEAAGRALVVASLAAAASASELTGLDPDEVERRWHERRGTLARRS